MLQFCAFSQSVFFLCSGCSTSRCCPRPDSTASRFVLSFCHCCCVLGVVNAPPWFVVLCCACVPTDSRLLSFALCCVISPPAQVRSFAQFRTAAPYNLFVSLP